MSLDHVAISSIRRSFEKGKGRVATLAPGQSRSFEIRLTAHATAESVAKAEKAVAAIQSGMKPVILDRPNPEWSAG